MRGPKFKRRHSLKRSPNDFLPRAVIELLLRDGNRSSLKVKRVISCVEILNAEGVLKQQQQDDRKRVEDEIIRKPNRIYWWEIAWVFRLPDVN